MANEQDRHHARCVELFDSAPGPLLVPAPILTEVCYLLERERGTHAEAGFLRSVRDDVFTLVSLTPADLDRMADLVETYADLPLGAADASVIAVAERLDVREVATTLSHPKDAAGRSSSSSNSCASHPMPSSGSPGDEAPWDCRTFRWRAGRSTQPPLSTLDSRPEAARTRQAHPADQARHATHVVDTRRTRSEAHHHSGDDPPRRGHGEGLPGSVPEMILPTSASRFVKPS
jgi:predicted nucleic acid-binding protein